VDGVYSTSVSRQEIAAPVEIEISSFRPTAYVQELIIIRMIELLVLVQ
jgi:hypothetical protein